MESRGGQGKTGRERENCKGIEKWVKGNTGLGEQKRTGKAGKGRGWSGNLAN